MKTNESHPLREGYVIKTRTSIERMRSSAVANPRWRLFFDDGTSFTTKPDASCGYGADNSEFRGRIQIRIERGQIVHIAQVD
jgi:hypothetical protein